MKILITGCAKTGTTLLRRLFNYYNVTVYNYKEISIDDFVNSRQFVAKRNFQTIFSNELSKEEIKRQLQIIKDNNIKIINITRKKEEVLKDRVEGNISKKRYEASMLQLKKYNKYVTYNIQYKDLVQNPDKIQKEISKLLKLKIMNKFSDYPLNMENLKEKKGKCYEYNNYSFRKIK